jgi:hypothetical protein
MFCPISEATAEIRPVSDKARTGTIWYYTLPAALTDTTVPSFPDDQILVDLMETAYREWLKELPKGSAVAYTKQQVTMLQKAGFGGDAEPDQIPFDPHYFGELSFNWNLDWMGRTTL